MKTSVSLSVFSTPPTTPALFHGDVANSVAQIADLGYDGVDLFIRDIHAQESREALRLLREKNLGVGVVMPAAMAGQGLFLGHEDKSVRDNIVRKLTEFTGFCSEAGGMLALGLVRGSYGPGDSNEALLARFADSVARLVPQAQHLGVELVVEPINRYEINTLNSSLEAKTFIEESGLPLYLMLDTFHMNIEDGSIEESFRACKALTKHIHFLDSNRLAPGMGHMDMAGLYRYIESLGYDGYLCLEALPKPDSFTCAQRGMEFFYSVRQ